MTKTIEIPDIAQWEETDSELAKYTIGKLQEENKQLKEQLEYLRKNQYLNQVKWERNYNEDLVKGLQQRINKAIEYLERYNIDFKNCKFGEAPISLRELGDLLDILRGNNE